MWRLDSPGAIRFWCFPTYVHTSSSSKSWTWTPRTRSVNNRSQASPASVRIFNTVRFSTSHRRPVPRTELPSTRQLRIMRTFSRGSRTSGLLLRFRESLAALLALPTLDPVPSVEAGFHHFESAIVVRHFDLAFFGRKRQNDCGRRNPAFGESPRLGPMSG